jgi:hypothetical protein
MYNDAEFIERFRIPRWKLVELADLFEEDLQYRFQRKGALNPAMQLMVALRFYASGSFQQVIGETFGITKMTVHKTIIRVSDVLSTVIQDHVFFSMSSASRCHEDQVLQKIWVPRHHWMC